MTDNELEEIARRYTNSELAMFVVVHMKKTETASADAIRARELGSAKIYHEVLGYKIKKLENL